MTLPLSRSDQAGVRALITHWVNQSAHQSREAVQDWWSECAPPDRFVPVWSTLVAAEFVQATDAQWTLTPNALQWWHKKPARHPVEQGWASVGQCLGRIHAWNEHAQLSGAPTVAALAVWGSLARPGTTEIGDVDLAIVWRRPGQCGPPTPPPSPPLRAALQARLNTMPLPPSCAEREEWLEQWLETLPLVGVSGVDQWDELSVRAPLSALCVWAASDTSSGHYGPGLRTHELDALWRHASAPKTTPMPRPPHP